MKKDFKTFQETFTKYQSLFGLTGYKIYFKHEKLDSDSFADICVDQTLMVATVRLNNDGKDEEFLDVERSAKHEAIHLLINKLQDLARDRYAKEEDITMATEEIVFKLEGLI
jgi:hypothetical protein